MELDMLAMPAVVPWAPVAPTSTGLWAIMTANQDQPEGMEVAPPVSFPEYCIFHQKT